MSENYNLIIQKVDVLNEKFDKLEKELEKLKEAVNTLITTTSRMDDHISFVEATYETLKTPLNYVKEKVSYLTS